LTVQEKELTSQIKELNEQVKQAKPDPARQKKLEKEIENFEKSKVFFYEKEVRNAIIMAL